MENVRLSQCMIVKNEERNIERVLSCAKDYAFEQIVVDTGSTDRTVELAKNMGAKVFHYEWINDFAAARNYAIEQASGNWLLILDADEYISSDDFPKLMQLINKIQDDADPGKEYLAINCKLVNINDAGKPICI